MSKYAACWVVNFATPTRDERFMSLYHHDNGGPNSFPRGGFYTRGDPTPCQIR